MGSSYVPLPREETYRLIRMAQEGDTEAKEAIVRQNTGLVKNIAVKFVRRGYELEDLMQVGFIGLIKAAERFDLSFEVMFSTYAVPVILGEIRRYIRDDGRIKVSRALRSGVQEMMRVQEAYFRENGEYPRISELAQLLGKSREEVLELMGAGDALFGTESLDDPLRPDTAAAPHREEEERRMDLLLLKKEILELEERERQVIILRYFRDMTQSQIAGRLGISQVQVSRIEKKVISRLREKIAE